AGTGMDLGRCLGGPRKQALTHLAAASGGERDLPGAPLVRFEDRPADRNAFLFRLSFQFPRGLTPPRGRAALASGLAKKDARNGADLRRCPANVMRLGTDYVRFSSPAPAVLPGPGRFLSQSALRSRAPPR